MQSYLALVMFNQGMFYQNHPLPLPWGIIRTPGEEAVDVMIYTADPGQFSCQGKTEAKVKLVGFCQYQDGEEVRPFLLGMPENEELDETQFKICEIKAARFLHRVFDVCSFGNGQAANALMELRYNK